MGSTAGPIRYDMGWEERRIALKHTRGIITAYRIGENIFAFRISGDGSVFVLVIRI